MYTNNAPFHLKRVRLTCHEVPPSDYVGCMLSTAVVGAITTRRPPAIPPRSRHTNLCHCISSTKHIQSANEAGKTRTQQLDEPVALRRAALGELACLPSQPFRGRQATHKKRPHRYLASIGNYRGTHDMYLRSEIVIAVEVVQGVLPLAHNPVKLVSVHHSVLVSVRLLDHLLQKVPERREQMSQRSVGRLCRHSFKQTSKIKKCMKWI